MIKTLTHVAVRSAALVAAVTMLAGAAAGVSAFGAAAGASTAFTAR